MLPLRPPSSSLDTCCSVVTALAFVRKMMLRQALCRRSAAATRAAPAVTSRTFSIANGLDLGLPDKYGHFIGGEFVAPIDGEYFDNISPIDGEKFIQAARGSKADVDKAVAVANEAFT